MQSSPTKGGNAWRNPRTSAWKYTRPPYPGNSGEVDQVCLQNKPNSPQRGEKIDTSRSSLLLSSPRAIQYFQNHKCTMLPKINIFQGILPGIVLLQILKSTMLSISHWVTQPKLLSWTINYLGLQNWHSKLDNLSKRLRLYELSMLYMNFLVISRQKIMLLILYQDGIKGESPSIISPGNR